MVVDTPGVQVLFATDIRNAHFEFTSYAAASDRVSVQDRFGNLVWETTGRTDLSTVVSFTVEWIYGLKVPTLTSGKLFMYFK
jgi:hypothetical protein